MSVLTLTPDEHAFAVTVVVLSSVGATTLASLFHAWRRAAPASFLPTYVGTMVSVAGFSWMLLGVPNFEIPSWGRLAAAVLGGAIACFLAQRCEIWITRRLRRHPVQDARENLSPGLRLVRPDLMPGTGPSGTSVLAWLVIVGLLEEVLFRGILVELALSVPGGLVVSSALLASTGVAFSLTHAQLRLTEAVLKLPLSVACLIICLLSGTILAPIIAHVGYNVWMWRLANIGYPARSPARAVSDEIEC